MLQPNDVFVGKYRITANLGSGGYATVYRARHVDEERDVAIKVLDLVTDTARSRFRLEAKLLEKLADPTIVQLLDHGVHGERPFLVLEYIEGQTLREVIDRNGALGPQRAVSILEQITTAVATAHALGALHRDLKPTNVMLTASDAVKVLDFGIAKIFDVRDYMSTTGPMTEIGKTVGTPRYMSPEALCGEPPTPASDVFSLGMVLFEMLTGERALPHLSDAALVRRMVDHDPIEIPEDKVPEDLRALLSQMLAKNLDERIDTAARVLTRLSALPNYDAETRVMMPHEFSEVHRIAGSNDEETQAVHARARPEPTSTSEEVRRAAAQLRRDAELRARPVRLTTPLPDDEEVEQEPVSRRTHATVDEPLEPEPGLDRPSARRTPSVDWRKVAGFGTLALGLLLAAGYFAGVVGIKVSIVDGHPLECEFGSRALHIERHFVVFGAEILRVGHDVRCSSGGGPGG